MNEADEYAAILEDLINDILKLLYKDVLGLTVLAQPHYVVNDIKYLVAKAAFEKSKLDQGRGNI